MIHIKDIFNMLGICEQNYKMNNCELTLQLTYKTIITLKPLCPEHVPSHLLEITTVLTF